MTAIVLYHPNMAAEGIETAELFGLPAYATTRLDENDVWLCDDPQVVAMYARVMGLHDEIFNMELATA